MDIGIDIGGTKIAAGLVLDNKLIKLISVKTKSNAPQEEVILQVTSLIDRLITKNTRKIGLAVPAIVDVEKGIVFETVNIPSWKKVPLKKKSGEKIPYPSICPE
ncbi:ROK family protein [Candidatus Woesearchaeota archaeon]|nr:ROK family protein [Candidatus Woesearchaeota archaeon]